VKLLADRSPATEPAGAAIFIRAGATWLQNLDVAADTIRHGPDLAAVLNAVDPVAEIRD
jgi:hypothetical protein